MDWIFTHYRCPKDNNLRYNYTLSSVQRFTLSAFHFRPVKSEEIFLHCLVLACLHSDVSSRCAKGCPFEKRKKRASEREVKRFLAVGPIIVSSSKPKAPPGMVFVMSLAVDFWECSGTSWGLFSCCKARITNWTTITSSYLVGVFSPYSLFCFCCMFVFRHIQNKSPITNYHSTWEGAHLPSDSAKLQYIQFYLWLTLF